MIKNQVKILEDLVEEYKERKVNYSTYEFDELSYRTLILDIRTMLKENQKYKEVIDRAVQLAYQYAQIDGGHHKMWVIDQMMRILLGSKYDNFVKEYEEDGEYEWNIGIAP